MAAQSEAASVKGRPFSARLMRAVLYSTSGRLASWSFLTLSGAGGSSEGVFKLLRDWRPRGPARKKPPAGRPPLSAPEPLDQHKLKSPRNIARLLHVVL